MTKTIGEVFGMTYEQAIDELREMYRDGNYIEESLDASDKELAMDIAIEAIEKQIPRKPLKITMENVTIFRCPRCGAELLGFDCHECHQTIDYGDEYDE
jgi:hypothetical protein